VDVAPAMNLADSPTNYALLLRKPWILQQLTDPLTFLLVISRVYIRCPLPTW
jgi:hypothetical protein